MVDFKPTREQLVLDNLKGGMQYDQWLVENVKTRSQRRTMTMRQPEPTASASRASRRKLG
jgi:hypothetical protein